MKIWHPTKNIPARLEDFSKHSRTEVWLICDMGHESLGQIRSLEKQCIYCSGQKTLPGFNDLASLLPDIAAQWHPNKNSPLTASEVTSKSGKKVWWVCERGHEFEAIISNRLTKDHCPVCYGRQTLTGFNDLSTLYPELSKQWHPTKNLPLLPNQIAGRSSQKAWWLCDLGHEWESSIKDRHSRGCPVCGNKKILIGFNDLANLRPDVLKRWDYEKNTSIKPTEVVLGSHKKVWWRDDCGHTWFREIYSEVNFNRCPECSFYESEAELFISNYLQKLGLEVVKRDRKILKGKELDIFLPELNIAIEYNGAYWHSKNKGKDSTYHYEKWEMCKNINIDLIYIWDFDWKTDRQEILKSLSLLAQNKTGTVPPNDSCSELVLDNGSLEQLITDLSKFEVTVHIPASIIPNLGSLIVWDAGKTVYRKIK